MCVYTFYLLRKKKVAHRISYPLGKDTLARYLPILSHRLGDKPTKPISLGSHLHPCDKTSENYSVTFFSFL